MRVEFTVPGEPRGKGRPRFARKGGFVYTDHKTKDYENMVKAAYRMVYGDYQFPEDSSLLLFVTAYFKIPKSTSKRKADLMRQGVIRPTKTPDWDNIGKIIADGCNKLIWDDDSHVIQGTVEKFYSDDPRVDVVVLDMEEYEKWLDG